MLKEIVLPEEQKEIRRKKNFLKRFYWDTRELEKLEKKLEQINIKISGIKTSSITAMPKSILTQDISDLLAQQEEYQHLIFKRIMKLEKNKQNIELSIDTLEDSKLRLILTYTYLEGYSYKEIAAALDKSDRHIRRLHDDAIRLIKIIEK